MARRPNTGARRGAARAIPVLAVAVCALAAAAAYAATRPPERPAATTASATAFLAVGTNPTAGASVSRAKHRRAPGPALPRISAHPEPLATEASASFAFLAAGATSFQCRLDGSSWAVCRSPRAYAGLAAGTHTFSVRGLARRAPRRAPRPAQRPSARAATSAKKKKRALVAGPAASFTWRVIEPKSFSIQPQLGSLQPLLPGAPAQPLPLVVVNPNEVPIFVTSIGVSAAAGPAGCDSAANLELLPAGVSATAPLSVPAGGSVSLPAPGVAAPAIALRDLPTAQDACEGGSFQLDFVGEGGG